MTKENYRNRNTNYRIEIIDKVNEFFKLKSQWDELARTNYSLMPFLCFDWFKIWIDHFLKDRNQLFVILLYDREQLAAITPFTISIEKIRGIKIKKIELIGNLYSPFRYLLFRNQERKKRELYLSYILEYISKTFKKWDMIDFNSIPTENGCYTDIRNSIIQHNFKNTEYFCFRNWYIDEIACDGDKYIKQLNGNIRQNVPRRIRKLNRIGNAEFEMIIDSAQLNYYMNLYYDLYAKSWQKKETVGPTFHRNLSKIAADNGWLRLGFLFFNNTPIACQMWIVSNDYAYILKLFYDQEYKKYAPGKILTFKMFKYAIDADKVKTIDFGYGNDNYKKFWTPKNRVINGIKIYNKSIKGSYLCFIENTILPLINKYHITKKVKEILKNRLS
jgi:CelD/BcsL family acetyltransferase involved in cellulose biosynthesis